MKTNERGLALLLVVSLMALVTLIVVSLAVITRIETRVGQAQAEQDLAREHALMGLHTALGRLQEAAGPDRRVTATAEATGATLHPHWVGVWRSDQAGTEPETWLVSGEAPDPEGEIGVGQAVQLVVGDETEAMAVVAPRELVAVSNERDAVRGSFAYYIADQGLKAPLAAAAAAPASDDYFAQRRLLMGGARPLGFGDSIEIDAGTSDFQEGLAALQHYDQVRVLTPENQRSLQARWHDYSGWSRGLLVDTAQGGIKTDLSLAGDAAIPGLAAFANLATPERQRELSPTYPIRAASGGSGELYDGIHPVITQMGMQFDVRVVTDVSLAINARMKFFVELSNLFSSALESAEYRLKIYGIPDELEIESRSLGTGTDQGSATVDLSSYFAENIGSEGERYVGFDLPAGNVVWAPGRSVNWKLPSSDAMSDGPDRSLDPEAVSRDSTWTIRLSERLSGPDRRQSDTELRFTTASSWLMRVELVVVDDSGAETEVGNYNFPEFDPTESAWIPNSGQIAPEGDFGFHVRFIDREDFLFDQDVGSPWLSTFGDKHILRRDYSEEFFVPAIDFESASYHVNFSNSNSAVERRQVFGFGELPDFFSTHHESYNADVALFELPRQPWLSVGSLQHLPFTTGPIYNVGNSWSERNDWFDAFFFSGRAAGALVESGVISPVLERVREADPLIDARSGQQWWVRAPFNINSVRPAAWAAVLRGLGTGLGDLALAYTTHAADTGAVTGAASEVLPRPMARFVQSAGETWEISPNPTNFQAVLRTYRRGARSLTDPQVRDLSVLLAELIEARVTAVGPYRSMAEFLAPDPVRFDNRNVVEQAIVRHDENAPVTDRINWDHYFPDTPIPIDQAAPSFLTSADFMTPLAPQLSARSDTFLIRAYGETVPETTREGYGATEPTGRAWVEALVQRFPEGVDASDYVQADDADWRNPVADENWGRRFRVIALRWLNEEDL